MDPEPAATSRLSTSVESSTRSPHQEVKEGIEEEDPYSLTSTSIALLGTVIAIASIGVPLLAVLTERPLGKESIVPTALESDGSKSSLPISLTRIGKSSS